MVAFATLIGRSRQKRTTFLIVGDSKSSNCMPCWRESVVNNGVRTRHVAYVDMYNRTTLRCELFIFFGLLPHKHEVNVILI